MVGAGTDSTLESLLESVARRDQAAFRSLYDLAAPKLLGIALRILRRRDIAEDVVQDVFVKLWTGKAVFDPVLGSGFAFLATIARNRALDIARRRVEVGGEAADMEDMVDLSPSPEAVASDRAEFRALLLCLAGLADGPRNAIMAAYLDGATGEEIARKLAAPAGTVKSWIHRGLAALRECLGR